MTRLLITADSPDPAAHPAKNVHAGSSLTNQSDNHSERDTMVDTTAALARAAKELRRLVDTEIAGELADWIGVFNDTADRLHLLGDHHNEGGLRAAANLLTTRRAALLAGRGEVG
jgi:hypothetical protein